MFFIDLQRARSGAFRTDFCLSEFLHTVIFHGQHSADRRPRAGGAGDALSSREVGTLSALSGSPAPRRCRLLQAGSTARRRTPLSCKACYWHSWGPHSSTPRRRLPKRDCAKRTLGSKTYTGEL